MEQIKKMALRPCKECKKEISTDAKVCPHCGKKVGMSAGSGCLVVVLIFIGLGVVMSGLHQSGTGGVSTPTIDPKSIALSQLSFDFKGRKAGFDNIMEADFIIKNGSTFDIKDLVIKCRHFAKSETEIDSNTRTIYDVIKAHSTKKFKNFNMGFIHTQAVKSSCAVSDLSIAP
jgi:hypothetical protein